MVKCFSLFRYAADLVLLLAALLVLGLLVYFAVRAQDDLIRSTWVLAGSTVALFLATAALVFVTVRLANLELFLHNQRRFEDVFRATNGPGWRENMASHKKRLGNSGFEARILRKFGLSLQQFNELFPEVEAIVQNPPDRT